MRQIFNPIAICIFALSTATGQVYVTVTTDKSIYSTVDTLWITVYAHNPMTSDTTMVFRTSCQYDCYIDTLEWGWFLGCYFGSSRRTIPAQDSVAWHLRYPYFRMYHPTLTPGIHRIVGVMGKPTEGSPCIYSDTIEILVTDVAGVASESGTPVKLELSQNYPNPFNPNTTIRFDLPAPRHVTLKVFDLLGREVATLLDEQRREGEQTVRFDASRLTSGIYVYRLQAGASSVTVKKMVVVR